MASDPNENDSSDSSGSFFSEGDPTLAREDGSASEKPFGWLQETTQGNITEQAGDMIGAYKLLQQIGEGGFGVVYLAEQDHPVKRRVALKIIKPGMDTKEVIARFEAERQALALMDHPGIAKVFDAGATATGRPYFVMELVKGVPVSEYCDTHHYNTRERLELFRDICGAVQHAHQKGVIHRDLKPSNILVTHHETRPVIKVIDFGIAKSISQELTEQTLFTAFGQMVGTPQYMSPEQAEMSGLDVDTRSDIYALGVVLYELLTGRTPLDAQQLRKAGLDKIHQLIREVEPPKPSTKLTALNDQEITALARAHRESPEKLARLVRGDLDWIVMKALDKDRNRRYETATGFAEDIRRYLEYEPVLASPPSAGYRLGKFARRNKAAITTAAMIAVSLVAAAAVSAWQAVEATEARRAEANQREIAEANEVKARAVLEFFQDKVMAAARPKDQAGGLGINATIKEAIDAAEPKIVESFADRPQVEASIRSHLGTTYRYLGEAGKAVLQEERALEIDRKLYGLEHPNTLSSMQNLAISYGDLGRIEEALELNEKSLELNMKVFGSEHPGTLGAMQNLANSYNDSGRFDKALEMNRKTLELKRKVLGPKAPGTLSSMQNLAISYGDVGLYREALDLAKETLELKRQVLGPWHPDTLGSMQNLAISYGDAGSYEDASILAKEALELKQKVLGPKHPDTLGSMQNLANSYGDIGRFDEAMRLEEKTLALKKEVLGPKHPDTLGTMNNLANSYDELGHHERALGLKEATLEFKREVLGPEHPDTLSSMQNLANSYSDIGRYDDALLLEEKTLLLKRKVLGPEHPETLNSMQNLASSYTDAGRYNEALDLKKKTLNLKKKVLGPEHPRTLISMQNLANSFGNLERYQDALILEEETLEIRKRVLGPEHPDTLQSMSNLAISYSDVGRHDEALHLKEKTLSLQIKVFGSGHPDTLKSMISLAHSLADVSRHEEASEQFLKYLEIREAQGDHDWEFFYAKSSLGNLLVIQKKYIEAEPWLLAGFEGISTTGPENEPKWLIFCVERLVELYMDWGKPEAAAGWKEKLKKLGGM